MVGAKVSDARQSHGQQSHRKGRQGGRIGVLGILLLLFLTTGCMSRVRVHVKTSSDVNEGRPFQLLVRAATDPRDKGADYDSVARLAVQPSPDVIHQETLFPGSVLEFRLRPGKTGVLFFYLLMTTPDGCWYEEVPLPRYRKIELKIDADRLQPPCEFLVR